MRSAQSGSRAADYFDGVRERRLASTVSVHLASSGIDGDVPEPGAGHSDFCWELIKCAAVIGVAATVLERAEIRVVHQADITELRTLDDDQIVFIEVLALVYEFHGCLQQKAFSKNPDDSMTRHGI